MNDQIKKKIDILEKDIKSIKIQGATNIALATIEGVKIYAKGADVIGKDFISEVVSIGDKLSKARKNEPLARNFVRYLKGHVPDSNNISSEAVINVCKQYEGLIANSKKLIVEFGTEELSRYDVILTHCHSSTVTGTLINTARLYSLEHKKELEVVSTETRPLYQGRRTARELIKAGVKVTQIVDSACASFITNDQYLPVEAVIVGCDELLKDGSFINKVGSFSIALAAHVGEDSFYVATTLLKLDHKRSVKAPEIELRDAAEVWEDAPKGLNIINPAFELVRPEYVTKYITEAGVILADEIEMKAKEIYPWMFT